ncbi:MAG TPA: EAL domain-containing protein [Steroidobacteraceae bacterium]|nr:EAL domain-containing protein [Steroidobacteraceae bacterium]
MQAATDLMLILDGDASSIAALHAVADRLGCDRIEVSGAKMLAEILPTRKPTLVAIAIDRHESDLPGVLQTLVQCGIRPPTLLFGDVNARVLASVKRVAEARGFGIIGTRNRPLDIDDLERLLNAHTTAPAPIGRAELDQALAEQQFLLRYQPKVALAEGRTQIQGVEALVRWQHPRRGELQPRQFLGAIETHGLMAPLTDIVITEAIRQAGQWRAHDLSLEMAINLSPRLVKDRAFPDRLAALLQEYEVPAQQVVLDVTETCGSGDKELLLDVFTRLRILGVGLSLDNFGTGLSSLSELYQMPFSEIKVDGAILIDVQNDHEAELIVRAIADLAHGLGLVVCAEGIETKAMLDFARSAKFDSAQGRLFCGPVLASDIERLVRAWPESAAAATGTWRALRAPIVPPVDEQKITKRMRRLKLAGTEEIR